MTIREDVAQVIKEQPTEFGLTSAVVVQHHGEIVAEAYGPDTDANTPLLSWSIAKSFTHALAGVLVDSGDLSLDAPAPVPEWSNPSDPRHEITLDHLLKMRSGLTFVEDYVDDATSDCLEMLFGSGREDMASYAASQSLLTAPGALTNYSSGTTNIVSRMLADVVGSGPAFEAWANEVLFSRIGIDQPRMDFDAAGTWTGSSYLFATAREYINFGQLYLQNGTFGGDRVLPASWIEYGATPSGTTDDGDTYCAHWWMWSPDAGISAAQGYETQRILVWPQEELVAVRFGKTPIELGPNVDEWLANLIGA